MTIRSIQLSPFLPPAPTSPLSSLTAFLFPPRPTLNPTLTRVGVIAAFPPSSSPNNTQDRMSLHDLEKPTPPGPRSSLNPRDLHTEYLRYVMAS